MILLNMLLFTACDNTSESTDCNGVPGGNSEIDCNNICGGDAVEDECGICNGDNSSCEYDCAGNKNGSAYTNACCFCIDNGIDFDCDAVNLPSDLITGTILPCPQFTTPGKPCSGTYCSLNYMDECLIVDDCGVCGGDGTIESNGYILLWDKCYNIEDTKELDLSYSNLTGSIPTKIGELINLNILNLSNNSLSGSIPTEITNLTNLSSLILYNNQLTGNIPSEIGNLSNLENLLLNANQLEGIIPLGIGSLIKLSTLYLSGNKLSGNISSEICNISDEFPNLEDNQLCPPYPSCLLTVGNQNITNCN